MLHEITSTLPNFAKITFEPGMNFILAEGDKGKGRRATANSVGKSSIFYLIDYLLGGNANKDFEAEEFANATFTLDATLGGKRVRVTRAVNKGERNKVVIQGNVDGWPELTIDEISAAERTIQTKRWQKLLGKLLFELPDTVPNCAVAKAKPPTARELLTFFNRKGFTNIVKAVPQMGEEKGNIICSYLLGLNWEYGAAILGLKSEDEVVASIRRAAEFEKEKACRSKKFTEKQVRKLEEDIRQAEEELTKYKVLPLFEVALEKSDDWTDELRMAEDAAAVSRRRIAAAKKSIETLKDDPAELVAFYEKAKADLGMSVKKTLQDVQRFHNGIREHRVKILSDEIKQNEKELKSALENIAELDEKRSVFLQSEDMRDTLAHFREKQSQLDVLKKELAAFQQANQLAEDADTEEARIMKMRVDIASAEKEKFELKNDRIASLADKFKRLISDLYADDQAVKKDGFDPQLNIAFLDGNVAVGRKKPYQIKISATLQGDRGQGKGHAKVCAFDLVAFELNRGELGRKIDFLLHDSSAFESPDANQFVGLMQYAAAMTNATQSQYICATYATRFNDVCAKDERLQEIARAAHFVTLSEKRKLYGFDY